MPPRVRRSSPTRLGRILRLKLSAPPTDPARAGVLLLHHHNDSEGQVEVIPVRVTWPHNLYLPAISR